MIDLTQTAAASTLVHTVPHDPGIAWRSERIAVDAPPDESSRPSPDARWSASSRRTGLCGVVSPRVVALSAGGYRMYYTQLLPRPGFPAGANDYDHCTSRILSATSIDGMQWIPEPGVRLTASEGGAGDFRVVSSEVVPRTDHDRGLRMYYECCRGPQSIQNSIRSAVSDDGLQWTAEPGARLEFTNRNLNAPRILFLEDGRCRLFVSEPGSGIISAVSDDGGVTFVREPGIRIVPDGPLDSMTAFAPEILRLHSGTYRMYYAGYGSPTRAHILTAKSTDGLHWQKSPEPVLSPGTSPWNAAKCSEMCVVWNPRSPTDPIRMFYEACDGTAQDQRGVWRIASAVAVETNGQ